MLLVLAPTQALAWELPEVVDDAVDLDVALATPPWGPKVAAPHVNILWIDFTQDAVVFKATVRLLLLRGDPGGGQSVVASGSVAGERISLGAGWQPGVEPYFGVDRCPESPGAVCAWAQAGGVVDRNANTVTIEAEWASLPAIHQGDRLSRTAGASYAWDGTHLFADFAPNGAAHGLGVYALGNEPRKYGNDYVFS